MRYKDSYMNFIMSPPTRDGLDCCEKIIPSVGSMKVLAKTDESLGEITQLLDKRSVSESMMMPWTIGISVFVISAFTAVTIYIIMSQMRRGR